MLNCHVKEGTTEYQLAGWLRPRQEWQKGFILSYFNAVLFSPLIGIVCGSQMVGAGGAQLIRILKLNET